MKKTVCILTLALCCIMVQAQPQGRFNPGDFNEKLEQAIRERAGFTDAEAVKFFQIYHEMRGKQRALNQEASDLKRNTHSKDGDEVSAKAIKRINAIKVEVANIEQNCFERLCKELPAAKVLRAMKAEDKFHRDMLKQMSGHPEQGKGRQRHNER